MRKIKTIVLCSSASFYKQYWEIKLRIEIASAIRNGLAMTPDFFEPTFLLNPISKILPNYEEVMGVIPIILNGDLNRLSLRA